MSRDTPKTTIISPLLPGFDEIGDFIHENPEASWISTRLFVADYLADRGIVNIPTDEVELVTAILLSFCSKTNSGLIEAMPALINLFKRWAVLASVPPEHNDSPALGSPE